MDRVKARIGDACLLFFYWWYNQPGSNTKEGFERWWREGGKEYGRFVREEVYEEILQELRNCNYFSEDSDYGDGYDDGRAHTIAAIRQLKEQLSE